jgi:hypothetical protein
VEADRTLRQVLLLGEFKRSLAESPGALRGDIISHTQRMFEVVDP